MMHDSSTPTESTQDKSDARLLLFLIARLSAAIARRKWTLASWYWQGIRRLAEVAR